MRLFVLLLTAVTAGFAVQPAGVLAQSVSMGAKGGPSVFSDKINTILGIGPGPSGDESKDAVVLIELSRDDKGAQFAVFDDAAAWAQFVSIWKAALKSPNPDRTGPATLIGKVPSAGTSITVFKFFDGAIMFGMAPGDPNQRVFALDPSLFEAFNSKAEEISKILQVTP